MLSSVKGWDHHSNFGTKTKAAKFNLLLILVREAMLVSYSLTELSKLPIFHRFLRKGGCRGGDYVNYRGSSEFKLDLKGDLCSLKFLNIFSFFYSVIFVILFSLPLSPLIPAFPLQSPHCCPCPWVLFPFYSTPPALPLSLAVILLSMSLSLFCLFSLVCSLDSTCEWNPMVFVFLWLSYFT